ncbi:MAG: type II toxin-antitoxin system Phd/YefM family antitoxin [Deltaproteobacteria bacterium]|nr:type II toxin-antitoxin system Phd/YefM family antitoxin [Deltaproteobacteria bacterium]
MVRYLTASEARQRFLRLVDEACDGDQIVVTRHGSPAVVLIDYERLETLRSLARLWQDPEALRAMREAEADVEAGRVLRTRKVPGLRRLISQARRRGLLRG